VSDDLTSLDGFGGTVRLFPLPNLVLYPFVVQPLHVFEPRYRQLMADALADDRLMALALLRPGWEAEYHQRPPIFPAVCIGRIFKEERLEDGRYNLLLHGVARARVIEEFPANKPYRSARVEVLADIAVSSNEVEKALREELGRRMAGWFAAQPAAREQLQKLLHSGLALGTLCDVFAFALPLDLEIKQQLLEEPGIERRASHLLARLEVCQPEPAKSSAHRFPPDFSAN
jgi:Lon protease-like protein